MCKLRFKIYHILQLQNTRDSIICGIHSLDTFLALVGIIARLFLPTRATSWINFHRFTLVRRRSLPQRHILISEWTYFIHIQDILVTFASRWFVSQV